MNLDRWPHWVSDDGAITLINADCLEVLPEMEPGSVVTDPPYGRSFSSGWEGPHKGRKIAGDGDTVTRDAMLQIWGNRPALVFGSWRRPVVAARQAIVWDKGPASGMGDLSIPWKESWELIFVCGTGFSGFRSEGIICGHTIVTWASRGREHPNQKPVGLMAALTIKCPDGAVCDPFMGSGTTGVACIRTGRRFVGIEIDPTYYAIAAKRIQEELRLKTGQGPLFGKLLEQAHE